MLCITAPIMLIPETENKLNLFNMLIDIRLKRAPQKLYARLIIFPKRSEESKTLTIDTRYASLVPMRQRVKITAIFASPILTPGIAKRGGTSDST